MRNLRLFILGFSILFISLSCVTLMGGSKENEETAVKPTRTSNLPVPKASGLITKVTMARGATDDNFDPVDPTLEFDPSETIHAVVAVKKAPPKTNFRADWYITDVGDPKAVNFLINSTATVQAGSGNLDFTLSPKKKFSPGLYRVELYINDELDQLVEFKIVESQ
ncbi:hypothetical protein ADM99_00170 [Leptolinea tardivitalis]|uniref:Lipoprotein n=1 Tax=Leptolinea tardivitalis TaxID=229920 RepID=A0A0N8GME6_9CHLR|nr:hypothetical protein ADM99_00170 [Leptolinea tardivitalis]GAP20453.1 hypothetical protein LTAR_00643 [Leptolinea tardivitalis]